MQKTAFAAGICLAAAVAVSGCTTSRFGTYPTYQQPAPLNPAPSGQVTAGQLPPPVQPGVAPATQGTFPVAPGMEGATATDPNAAGGSVQNLATAKPVTREGMVGAWKVATGGSSCQIFFSTTQWTGGFRAATRGCPGDAANVSAWDVSGQQVVLKDSNDNKVGTLFPTGSGSFSGQTVGGMAITLTR
ncbi:protease inhibitor Inh/omp19 family protein [Oricola thermophila]|uniref:Protease inhibitor Inh/omp19 family protein n=1 Tax=Oricola thermophila TaxID=2742145 RepID=A0A6N1VGP4_9HYPH|nr:protease inhibitor Inh/omp19 family protein [Oricola thermophila]QKV19948.1 protease inhibitor Inh/omp19 family protein [Oricola thermophila]